MGISLRRKFLSKKINCGENVNFGLGITVTGENNISFGKNITIMDFSYLYVHNEGHLKIGDNFSMNTNSCLGAADGGEIIIGNNVIIAQNVVLRAADHEFKSVIIPILEQGHIGGKIIIGEKEPYEYLIKSIENFINQDELIELMQKNYFTKCEYRNLSGGVVAIHSGWKI